MPKGIITWLLRNIEKRRRKREKEKEGGDRESWRKYKYLKTYLMGVGVGWKP
jgi:hypothetical protein